MATSTLPSQAVENKSVGSASEPSDRYFSRFTSGSPAPWNLKTLGGLLALVAIWAAWMYWTWAYWGNLTADCGREMYVATVLSEGKTLYRDVWFNFGPVAPYFNSVLFRIFGIHLNVLYWAGSLAALGSAISLYLAGMKLSSCFVGWTAAAVLLCESFHPSLFSFPLPYSFSSVYGCLATCLFLWLAIHASNSTSRRWIFAASWATVTAVLLKPEFGASCSLGLVLLIAARAYQRQSWKSIPKDLLAMLPAILMCGLVIVWMVSLAGAEFLTQENLQSWPTSYFMKTYGKEWLAFTGFTLTSKAFLEAARRTIIVVGVFQGLHLLQCWKHTARRLIFLRMALFIGAIAYFASYLGSLEEIRYGTLYDEFREASRYLFFPQDMVLYVGIAAIVAWWYFLRQPGSTQNPGVPLLLTVSALIAIRLLLKMLPWGYPIFFNGPAVLSFLLVLDPLFPRAAVKGSFVFRANLLICCACLIVTLLNSRRADTPTAVVVPLTTERGTIKVTPSRAEQYRAAISFMREKADHGEYVLSVPEDTSLYFLSGTHSPSRVFAFTPGMIAPGKMTEELFHEIETKNVRYLIWSNRIFWEYGVPRFGADFDQTLGTYLTTHYHRVRPLLPGPVKLGEWNAYIWERNTESDSRQSPPGEGKTPAAADQK
jgi:hypothetical protein